MRNQYQEIGRHYQQYLGEFTVHHFAKGPVNELPVDFSILKFAPNRRRNNWIYATCGMSDFEALNAIELYIFSPVAHDFLIELLTIIAHYHVTGGNLGWGHTVYFGCPWYPESDLRYGLLSLPYLDGPAFEKLQTESKMIQFLWLLPITEAERDYKKQKGLEALEQRFDEIQLDYLDPFRESVV